MPKFSKDYQPLHRPETRVEPKPEVPRDGEVPTQEKQELHEQLGEQAGITKKEMRTGRPIGGKTKLRYTIPDAMKVLHEEFLTRLKIGRTPGPGHVKRSEPEDMVEWSRRKLQRMAPHAVAELEWQLRYGKDAQRMAAAERVLAASGLDKKDGSVGGSGFVVLNINGGLNDAPFLRRAIEATKATPTLPDERQKAIAKKSEDPEEQDG